MLLRALFPAAFYITVFEKVGRVASPTCQKATSDKGAMI